MKKTHNQDGFTLIEVLIAAIIVTFGLAAMGSFLGNYLTRNGENEHRTGATVLAQEKIEELRTQSLQGTLATTTTAGTAEAISNTGVVLGPTGTAGEIYTRSWVIDATVDPKPITVTVTWSGLSTRSQVVLSTLVNDV